MLELTVNTGADDVMGDDSDSVFFKQSVKNQFR